MGRWTPLPLNEQKLYQNVDETGLQSALAALENAYVNDAGGISRFPGLRVFADLPDDGRVFLHEWQGDGIAGTSNGRVYRVHRDGRVTDVTGVPVEGGRRLIFARSDERLAIAAGGPIVQLRGEKTELLSDDAPLTSHVSFIDGYTLAIENQFFRHSDAGDAEAWDPLNVFRIDGAPDAVSAMLVTPYREILLAGEDSIEQWERLASGETAFFRRWSLADGLLSPDLITFADNGAFVVTAQKQLARLNGQSSSPISGDIARVLTDPALDWTDAWLGGFPSQSLSIAGHEFLLLQMPKARTPYGGEGLTYLYDLRRQRFLTLYGWDEDRAQPARWPGWSFWQPTGWPEPLIGGDGVIYALDVAAFANAGALQRVLVRTAHVGDGEVSVDNLRLRVKRGVGTNDAEPTVEVRCRRDNLRWGRWVSRGLGKIGKRLMNLEFGAFGCGHSFQFEIRCTGACEIEILKGWVSVEDIGF